MKFARISIALIVLVLAIAVGFLYTHSQKTAVPSAPVSVNHLNADAYPLYPGNSWGSVASSTYQNFSGFAVRSKPVANVTDIAGTVAPFVQYYAQKLPAAGWKIDTTQAAGGPGSEVIGYKKGEDELVLSYNSVFKAGGINEPEQCPCDVTMTVFSGSKVSGR